MSGKKSNLFLILLESNLTYYIKHSYSYGFFLVFFLRKKSNKKKPRKNQKVRNSKYPYIITCEYEKKNPQKDTINSGFTHPVKTEICVIKLPVKLYTRKI